MELLEFLGLTRFADIPASELSGGQRRLLALGRAIAMKPKLLLLDEPGAGLSPVNIDNLMETILVLKERYQLTVVVVEHNMELVKCADWVNDLGPDSGEGGGGLVASGSPEQVAAVTSSLTGRYLQGLLASG